MHALSERHFTRLSEGIRDLYSQFEPEAVKRGVLGLISNFIGVDIATVDQVEADGSINLCTYPVAEIERANAACPILATYLPQHPSIAAFQRREQVPVRLTDHVTMRRYRSTALYCEVYRPLGVLYQMNAMPPGAGLRNTAVTLHRRIRDFGEADRSMLAHIGIHFAQSYSNAFAWRRQTRHRTLLRNGLSNEKQEVVMLDGQGQPHDLTRQCQSWLSNYFPSEGKRSGLPAPVCDWINKSRTARRQPTIAERVPPLKVTRPEGSLELRFLADADGDELLLICEKQSPFSPEALKPLGISPREAEVFRWVAEGKTDEEIGVILSMSAHTAHKHVQNILKKVGVSNRTAALLRLCEISGAI